MKQLTDEIFEVMINKYHGILVSIAYSYMRDNFYAEDIVQESFIKLYRARKRFESEEHIKNWLIRVTIVRISIILTFFFVVQRNYIDEEVKSEMDKNIDTTIIIKNGLLVLKYMIT